MTGQTEDQPITSADKREKAEQMQEMATGQVYPKPETVTENFVPSDQNNNKENDDGGIQEKSVKVSKVSMDSLESFACPVTSFAGWDKVVPYRDFICISDVKTSDGEDILVVDTSALPLEKSFKKMYRGKQLYRESMDAIFKFTNIFINNCVKSTKFSLLIYANDGSSIAPSGKCAKMFYKVLQECSGRMANCTIINASLKLKTLLFVKRPFMKTCINKKISLVNDMQSFLEAEGLPDSVSTF
ncbi:uncharacterized protein [Montipora foliosa]|uniref:uncharacterized protein n=1 Tax=Montipora foliosa TaxID=591990 RepID=UPI0035F1AD4A